MPFRAWLFVAALGCLIPLSGQAQEQGQPAQGGAQIEQESAPALPIPFPVDVVEDEATAKARERREAEAAQREKDDLIAQQGMNVATQAMNDATQRMARYTVISTALVGIGTTLLFVTLCLTWQANKAAQEAVAVTRRVGEAQVRAYLKIDSIAVGCDIKKDYVSVQVKCRNTGQSPAKNAIAVCDFGLERSGGHHYALRCKVGLPDVPGTGWEASGIGLPEMFFPIELWQDVLFIQFDVCAFYFDVFDKENCSYEIFILRDPSIGAQAPVSFERITGHYPRSFIEGRKIAMREGWLDASKGCIVLSQQA